MMMISTFCNLATFKAAVGDVGTAETGDCHQLVRQHHVDNNEAEVAGDDDDEEDGHQYHDNEEDGH